MRRNFVLTWALCTTACFTEPPSSTSSSGGSTSAASTGTTTGEDDDDGETSASESSEEGSTTTSGFGTASLGSSSSTGVDTLDTDEPAPEVLLDLYEDCDAGTWQTFARALVATSCDFTPRDEHQLGGGWRFETYDSPQFGPVEKALIIRPHPGTGGLTDASFNSGRLRFDVPGSRLRLRYEFVNTTSPGTGLGIMSFQIRRIPPGSGKAGNNGTTLVEELAANGGFGVVDIPLDIMGPLDDLVFIVIGKESVAGQGIALYEPEIVFEP